MVCVHLVWTVPSEDAVLQAGRCNLLNLNFDNVHKYIYCGVLHRFMRRSRLAQEILKINPKYIKKVKT